MISQARAENQWGGNQGRWPHANVSRPLGGVPRSSFAWAGVFVPDRTPSQCGTTLPSTARGLKLDGAAAEEVGVFRPCGFVHPRKPRPSIAWTGHPRE